MLNSDLADSSLASHWPDIAGAVDKVNDLLKEALAPFIPGEVRAAAFGLMDQILSEQNESSSAAAERDVTQTVVEVLRAIYGDKEGQEARVRMIAVTALKRLGKFGGSYQEIGDEFGVSRACPHGHSRRIQEVTGIRCRSDKKDSAREKCRLNRLGKRSPRRATKTAGIVRGGGFFGLFRVAFGVAR